MQVGILPASMDCRRDRRPMVKRYREDREYCSWRCHKCGAEKPVTASTIFEESHLSMRKILVLAICYVHQQSYEETRRACIFSVEDNSPSSGTIQQWFRNFREQVISTAVELQLNGPLLGGDGVVVQVDEALIGRRKYNRGRLVQGTWVVGMINEPGSIRLEICERRDAATLGDIVARHVAPGSIVHTDSWRGYARLPSLVFDHHQVNHSVEFVAPDGTHTQRIESQWRAIRRRFSQGGIRHEDIADYLIEYAWRRKCTRENMDPFVALMISLKL